MDYPGPELLHELFERQARATPHAVAVIFEDTSLEYRELDARANALARRLVGLGVKPESLVAVCLERGLEMPVALLAIMKAGGAYVPLDPSYPRERLGFMLEASGATVLLTTRPLASVLPAHRGTILWLDESAGESPDPPRVRVHPASLVYVMFTSGSTGVPKGVMNSHRGVVNSLRWLCATHALSASDAVLQNTTFGFDVSVWELFWPLLSGARLVMARPGPRDTAYLAQLIAEQHVSAAQFVPSMLDALLEEDLDPDGSLRMVLSVGEALNFELKEKFFANCSASLHNHYGPTEAAIQVSWWPCAPGGTSPVPIGRPMANCELYVVDEQMREVAAGAEGELLLGGRQLARGYLGRADLTAERFIPDPLSAREGSRLYRTGDLARYRADGVVEYLGRLDHQVKIRGFRIELGEIESGLRRHDGVQDAVVVALPNRAGSMRLVAYFVARSGPGPDTAALQTHLRTTLPDYMVPADYVTLPSLPLTSNGKVDRKALPSPWA